MGLQKYRQAERTIGEIEVMAGVRYWIPSRSIRRAAVPTELQRYVAGEASA